MRKLPHIIGALPAMQGVPSVAFDDGYEEVVTRSR